MPAHFIAALFAVFLLAPTPLVADSTGPLIDQLRGGGLVIYWRHAKTDWQKRDSDLSDMDRCATQRNLSAEGQGEARQVGEAFERLGIPVGDVLTSDFCRNRDTAVLAFRRYQRMPDLFNLPATSDPARRNRLVYALREMLAKPPEDPSVNTVIVGHNLNLRVAANVFIDEGGIAVFQPLGPEGFRHLGSLRPEDL